MATSRKKNPLPSGIALTLLGFWACCNALAWSGAEQPTPAGASDMEGGRRVLLEATLITRPGPDSPYGLITWAHQERVRSGDSYVWRDRTVYRPLLQAETADGLIVTVTQGYEVGGTTVTHDPDEPNWHDANYRYEGLQTGALVTIAGHTTEEELVIDAEHVNGGTIGSFIIGWWALLICCWTLGPFAVVIGWNDL